MAKISVSNTSNSNPKAQYQKIDKDLIKDMAPIEVIENPLRDNTGYDRNPRYAVYTINGYDSVVYYLVDRITLDIIYNSDNEEKVFKQATTRILQYAQKTFKEKFMGNKVAYYFNYQDWKIGSVAAVIFKKRTRGAHGYSYYEPYFKIIDEKGKEIRNFIRDCRVISEKDISQLKKLSSEYAILHRKTEKAGDKLRHILKKSGLDLKVINKR